MRVLLLVPVLLLLAVPSLANAAPADARCAATFSWLSQNARAAGVSAGSFDRMAAIAKSRQGASEASVPSDQGLTELTGDVVACHARYDGKAKSDTRVASAD